ncbi:MAG: hypothetical protein HQL22_11610 [Candidatus Omnitrophica bacterium]|nr:hypothetical protein [Candidatus Omnitrophota bacterium]
MKFENWLSRRNFMLAIIAAAVLYGTGCGLIELCSMYAQRQTHPFFFEGDLFAGVKGATGGEKYLGYMTDRDINIDKIAMRFTQAQFALAPVILDFNNSNHRLLILDFQDLKQAVALAQKLQLKLLKRSPQGLLFAERPGS